MVCGCAELFPAWLERAGENPHRATSRRRNRTRDLILTIGSKGVILTREGPCLLDFCASRDCSGLVFGGLLPQRRPKQVSQKHPRQRGSSALYIERDDTRSADDQDRIQGRADVAQLVEHLHGKEARPARPMS